jgi:hypothetical protein
MYIRQRDYDRVIQAVELQQVINTDTGVQNMAYWTALAKTKAKLKQKYYVDLEFTDTNVYGPALSYTGSSRVELDFPQYNPANTYNKGDVTAVGTAQYIGNQNTITGAFDATKWYLVGQQYDLWYLALPYQLFDMQRGIYGPGDIVYWFGNVYTCVQGTPGLSNSDELEAIMDSAIPFPNVFPNDPKNGVTYWGNPQPYNIQGIAPGLPLSAYTAYSNATNYGAGALSTYANQLWQSQKVGNLNITPGTDITAWLPIIWIAGDNRDQMVLDCLLHLIVFDLTPRIAADNVEDARLENMKRAWKMLTDLAQGEMNADQLIIIETNQGLSTQYGGVTKTGNTW